MGEWMEAYIDSKNVEPGYLGEGKAKLRRCWGFADRKGKCLNTFGSIGRVYCRECREYFNSGGWFKKGTKK